LRAREIADCGFDERTRAATYRGFVEECRAANDKLAAARLLDVLVRQVQRLLKTFQPDGAAALRHKARGRHSNNRIVDGVRDFALELIREHYVDFGPTLAREKLIERHQLVSSRSVVSKETLRKWMTEAGIWTSRRERKRRLHQPRGQRDCLGEMVQIDGSHHWWFENRGAKCALHRLHRRCDRQAASFALCRLREHVRLLPSGQGVSAGMGQAVGFL
jgi:hypothetical protein